MEIKGGERREREKGKSCAEDAEDPLQALQNKGIKPSHDGRIITAYAGMRRRVKGYGTH